MSIQESNRLEDEFIASIIAEEKAEYVKCSECDEWKVSTEKCSNPACWTGMGAYRVARREWEAKRDAYVQERQGTMKYANFSALREIFERLNPSPRHDDYTDRRSDITKPDTTYSFPARTTTWSNF